MNFPGKKTVTSSIKKTRKMTENAEKHATEERVQTMTNLPWQDNRKGAKQTLADINYDSNDNSLEQKPFNQQSQQSLRRGNQDEVAPRSILSLLSLNSLLCLLSPRPRLEMTYFAFQHIASQLTGQSGLKSSQKRFYTQRRTLQMFNGSDLHMKSS